MLKANPFVNPREPRTLLRRLLNQAEQKKETQPGAAPQADSRLVNGNTQKRKTAEASPVRPVPPEPTAPPAEQIAPQPRATQSIPTQIAGVEDRLKAEEALENLRSKTAQIANEFAEGKINRAQFSAMYAHINEKRTIIERLLARDPNTQAWQSVARQGHTTFLRQQFQARVLSYSIYDNGVTDPDKCINTAGPKPLTSEVAKPILTALAVLLKTRNSGKPFRALKRQIEDGQWLAIIPGVYTSAIVIFSLEPSTEQFQQAVDMHTDFERANRVTLERGIRQPDQLVFPHRALFEKPGQ